MRSSISIALFFLLSGVFLFTLLAALHRSRKAGAIAAACLAGVVAIIVFLTPVRLPSWLPLKAKDGYYRYVGGETEVDRGGRISPDQTTTTTMRPDYDR